MAKGDFIGRVLDGGYRIERRLGAGGMATVFLAVQERLERPVVVKVPDPALLHDETFRTRFVREIRSLVRLQHPHIVTVLDAGDLDGTPYAVMEYREGGSLRDRLDARAAQGRCERPHEVLEWLTPIAEALDHIHEEDVVHRDVKPGNILFDGKGNACLSDFGIAKALGSLDTGITRANTSPGSPAYMAPEAGKTGDVSGSSDQYSLGAIVYEALSGRRPIEGETPIAVMVKKLTETPRDLTEITEDLPTGVAAAVMRALGAVPENRFPSCGDFARAISEAAGVRGRTESAAETGTWVLADRSGAEPSSEETRTYVRGRPPVPRTASALSRRRWLIPVAAILLLLLLLGGAYLFRNGSTGAFDRYDPTARERFWSLTEGAAWVNAREDGQGVLTVEHARTGLVFVLVPGGRFRMGSTDGEEDERPVHEVTVRAFLLAKTECTQAAWDRIGGEDEREWRGAELPIDSVSWDDAAAWCRRTKLRLPSEAEWEYACRAGSAGNWAFGDDEGELGLHAVYRGNSDGSTEPVGGRRPNAWGLHDVHGNVAEWCEDDGHENYLDAPDDGSAWTDGGTKDRVCRGGAWDSPAEICRSAFRAWIVPGLRLSVIGFRPAFSLP